MLPLVPLTLFGVARAAAPVSVLGVLLDDPWTYVIVAVAAVLVGSLLMAMPPVERFAARALFGMRAPTPQEAATVEPLLAQVCAAAGIPRERMILQIEDSDAINAYATAGHLVCVTTRALRLPADELEAVLAHELGHHAELHPWISALTWWLQLPAVPLKALLRGLRGVIAAVGARVGGLARPIGVVLLALIWVVTFQVLWLVWVEWRSGWSGSGRRRPQFPPVLRSSRTAGTGGDPHHPPRVSTARARAAMLCGCGARSWSARSWC